MNNVSELDKHLARTKSYLLYHKGHDSYYVQLKENDSIIASGRYLGNIVGLLALIP